MTTGIDITRPSSGTVEAGLLLNGAYNVKSAGAVADNVTDDATVINGTAADALAAGKPLHIPAGDYRIGSTVTLRGHVIADPGARFYTSADIVAIECGSAGEQLYGRKMFLPEVFNAAKTGTGWSGSVRTGVRIINAQSCVFDIPRVRGFLYGLDETSDDATYGNGYNRFYVGILDTNKINHRIRASNSVGWVNENNYFGGRYHMDTDEGTNVADTRHLLIECFSLGNRPNNHRFWGPCLEGDGPEYHVEIIAGISNLIAQARWEAATPKVRFSELSQTYHSYDNEIYSGYNWRAIAVSHGGAGWSQRNVVRGHMPNTQTVTAASATVDAYTDDIIFVNYAGAVALTLPDPYYRTRSVVVKDISGAASSNNITITSASGNIDGAANVVFSSNYGSVTLLPTATDWFTA